MSQTIQYGKPPASTVVISYRNNQGKRMHAAFYDHYLIRRITAHKTSVAIDSTQSIKTFEKFIASSSHSFTLGVGSQIGERVSPITSKDDGADGGLIFIPGRTRDDDDVIRSHYEDELIRQARLRGQPLLAICAGSWKLWEAFGGKTVAVSDHCYASMPYITERGVVGNNKLIHDINVVKNSLLDHLMNSKESAASAQPLSVNSVHWLAPDAATKSVDLVVSAVAVQNDDIAPKNRQANKMKPTAQSVEAFESKHGVPMLGIQWHPEAGGIRNENILKYMAKAGDAYRAKQKMLEEFKRTYSPSVALTAVGIFRERATKNLSKTSSVAKSALKQVPK